MSFSSLFSQTSFSIIDTLVSGNSVQIKINNKTGAAHRIYGLGNITDKKIIINEQNIDNLSAQFIQENQGILKVTLQNLQPIKIEKRKNRWHLNYRQYYNNVPVYHSYFGYTINENGNILSLGSEIHPDISMDVKPLISRAQVLQIAKEKFKELSNIENPNIRKAPELTILPVENDMNFEYFLTYNVELESFDSLSSFSEAFFIDSKTGNIINQYSNLMEGYYCTISGKASIKCWP